MTSNFYEFIPSEQVDRSSPDCLRSHELEVGCEYFIVLTNSAGMYRYCIGDQVRVVGFEGQAPMLLESQVRRPRALDDGFTLDGGVLDLLPLLGALTDADTVNEGADWLHGTLVAAITRWVSEAADEHSIQTVALGGGCMLNRVLAMQLPVALEDAGLRVLSAHRMPPNDAAISLGQAWVAARA